MLCGKKKRTNFQIHQLKPVLHCRAASLESTSKGIEQQSCERDRKNRLLNFKHSKRATNTNRHCKSQHSTLQLND